MAEFGIRGLHRSRRVDRYACDSWRKALHGNDEDRGDDIGYNLYKIIYLDDISILAWRDQPGGGMSRRQVRFLSLALLLAPPELALRFCYRCIPPGSLWSYMV